MIGERVALVLGMFVAPLILVWLGQRFRKRSATRQSVFWGGVIGHTSGMVISLTAAMTPPIWWAGGNFWRDFAVHWSMLILFIAGAGIAAMLAKRSKTTAQRS